MAKTQVIAVVDELKNQEAGALERRDRFTLGVTQGHKSLPSIARRKAIREMSLFGYLSTIWRTLTPEEKLVWKTAGALSGLSGWQCFISDNAVRIRDDLELNVPPSELWQVRAGKLEVQEPATELILKQEHPARYWVAEKIAGKPWKNELIYMQENFTLPIELEIRYKADLTAIAGSDEPATAGTISGIVTLAGVPVADATVRCINQSNEILETTETTDASGEYEFTGLSETTEYHVCVEYADGETMYHAYSRSDAEAKVINFVLVQQTAQDAEAVNFALLPLEETTQSARFYARVWTSYQGQDVYRDVEIPFTLQQDWTYATETLSNIRGGIIGYTLYLEIVGYRGTVLFDNIRVTHGGTNWVRDPRCDAIDKTFSKGFSIVPPIWVPVSSDVGASYISVFPPSQ